MVSLLIRLPHAACLRQLLAIDHRADHTDHAQRPQAIFEDLALGGPGLPVAIPIIPGKD
jgi:hypothetical protein